MSHSVDFQRGRYFSPLSTISPSQANVTPAKRTVKEKLLKNDSSRQQSLLNDKENIENVSEKAFLSAYKIQNLDKCYSESTFNIATPTNEKARTTETVEANIYLTLLQEIFQVRGTSSPNISNEGYLYIGTVKLVNEAQEFIQAFKRALLCGYQITWLPLRKKYHFDDSTQQYGIHRTTEETMLASGEETVQGKNLFEEILCCISNTNKLLETQIEDQHTLHTKYYNYKSARKTCTRQVCSKSQWFNNDTEEELFYLNETLQKENLRLNFEVEQLERELQEIRFLREMENFAADTTISEKNEELSRLHQHCTGPTSSVERDNIHNFSSSYQKSLSGNHFDNSNSFQTPKATRKLSREAEKSPETIVDTRRRLRSCIEYLLEERSDTKRFEYAQRVTYEGRVKQLHERVREYEANVNALSRSLEERTVELDRIEVEKRQLSQVLEEKTQLLLSTSLQLEQLGSETQEKNCEIESLKEQLFLMLSSRNELTDAIHKVNEEATSLKEKARTLQERLDEVTVELDERQTELESLKKELARKDEQLASNYLSLAEMRSKLLNMENELEQTAEHARWQESQYQSKVNSLMEELRTCESRLEVAKSENKDLLSAIENEKTEKANAVSKMNKLVEENQNLSHQLTTLHDSDEKERDLAESRKRIVCLENELRKKEFEYSILQNDYAELHMKLEMEKDHTQYIDEETLSAEQMRRHEAERESAELREELRKLTQFIKKYRDRTESKMASLKMIVCQRDAAVEELKKVHQLIRNSEVDNALQERIVEGISQFFSQFCRPMEETCVSTC